MKLLSSDAMLRALLLFIVCAVSLSVPLEAEACTSFIVSGKATKDGRPMIFKNRDTSGVNNVVVVVQGELFRYLGITGYTDKKPRNIWAGHNEVGFAIMNTAAYNMNGCKGDDSDHDGWLMRRALEVCRSLSDFEHLLDTLPKPLNVNSNYGVIDAAGGCAYYETGDSGFVKFDANDPREAPDGYLVRTNHGMTGCREIDSGVERFMAITDFMAEAHREGHIDCEYLIAHTPRYLTHGLTKQNLLENMPKDENDVRMIHFTDYIPRFISSSAILIQGVAPGEAPSHTVSWTNIGWPCASVAIPLMLEADVPLPTIVQRDESDKAWLCSKSIAQKLKVFNQRRGNVRDYIDQSKLVNAAGTGVVQRIMPLEAEVFKHARKALDKVRKDKDGAKALREYYQWVDDFVKGSFLGE
ncbi:MAG: acyl-CoA--6-aminopenicillanic acid acyl-transferase [Bacteroidaceae bacterium]|nr:acyl-CoA--6-aminopenicillanic acid acyl-transferase [Bacteroidaceae bacterium]